MARKMTNYEMVTVICDPTASEPVFIALLLHFAIIHVLSTK